MINSYESTPTIGLIGDQFTTTARLTPTTINPLQLYNGSDYDYNLKRAESAPNSNPSTINIPKENSTSTTQSLLLKELDKEAGIDYTGKESNYVIYEFAPVDYEREDAKNKIVDEIFESLESSNTDNTTETSNTSLR